MFSRKKKSSEPAEEKTAGLSDKEYERIGRGLENVIIAGRFDKRRLFWFNFLRGVFFGIGSAIGATLIIATAIYVLNLFSELPWVGQLFENFRGTVEDVNRATNN